MQSHVKGAVTLIVHYRFQPLSPASYAIYTLLRSLALPGCATLLILSLLVCPFSLARLYEPACPGQPPAYQNQIPTVG